MVVCTMLSISLCFVYTLFMYQLSVRRDAGTLRQRLALQGNPIKFKKQTSILTNGSLFKKCLFNLYSTWLSFGCHTITMAFCCIQKTNSILL